MPNVILTHKSFARRYSGTFISCFLWPPFELENVDPAFLTIAPFSARYYASPSRAIYRASARTRSARRRRIEGKSGAEKKAQEAPNGEQYKKEMAKDLHKHA